MRLLATIILCFSLPFFSIISAQSWQIVDVPTNQNLARLDMNSASSGWAVSYDGLILRYDGISWQIADSLHHMIQSISCQEDTSTSDLSKIGDIYTIRLQDPRHLWIAVNHVKMRHYRLVQFNPNMKKIWEKQFPIKIRAFDFWKKSYGVAVGEGGGYTLIDGKWVELHFPVNLDFRGIKIISPHQFFVCGEKGTIIKFDGKWEIIKSPTKVLLRDLDFVSPDEGWFVGNRNTILHFKNDSITQQRIDCYADLWAVDMLSPKLGFAVGSNGTILKYDGQKWQKMVSPTRYVLHDIEMIDEQTGFALGQWGTILHYSKYESKCSKQNRSIFFDQVFYGSEMLIDRVDDVQGVAIADFNGDNHPDIYLTCYQTINHLLLNQGNGYFIDRVIESGAGGNIETRGHKRKVETGTLAADFDRDGDVDLLLAGKRGTTRLLVNNGKAVFTDKTAQSNLPSGLNISDGALGDFNEDGYPDILLVDENNNLQIFINKKYNRFYQQNIDYLSLPRTVLRAAKVIDFNNDGHQDILACYHHYLPILLINDGKGHWQKKSRITSDKNVRRFVNSITIADFNNDGYDDFFLCTENGDDAIFIYNSDKKIFENESTRWNVKKMGRSYSGVAGDFDLDGDVDLYVSRFGFDLLYLNENNRKFNEVWQQMVYSEAGYLDGYNTGAAKIDINRDGKLDLLIGNLDSWSSLLKNASTKSGYLMLDLRGTTDTREALGAKVWVWQAGKSKSEDTLVAYRSVNLSNGLFSQNSRIIHIGLGALKAVDIKIRFLNGTEKLLENIPRDTTLVIYQSGWLNRNLLHFSRRFLQIMHIPEVRFEIIKFIIFVLLIFSGGRFIEKRYQWRSSHLMFYMLVLIISYIITAIILRGFGGALYHLVPFGVIFVTLVIFIYINEQIFRSSLHQNMVQKKIQEASAKLSRIKINEKAISVVANTLKLIYPYDYLIFYLYYNDGNYFLCKKAEGIANDKIPKKLIINRAKVKKLAKENFPINIANFSYYSPELPRKLHEFSLIFPLMRKNDLLGLCILGFDKEVTQIDTSTISVINYLLLQLAIALDNIRILQNLEEQQKLAAIGTFASGIIHDLKNPIEGLRMIIEVMRNELTPQDKYYDYIEELYSGIKELKQKLVNSFDFVNYKVKSKNKVPLNILIREISEQFKLMYNAEIDLQLAKDEIFILGDRDQLKYAMENLMQNALIASDYEKPIQISTSFSKRTKSVQVDIIDHGEGIPDENLDKIFHMFYSTRGSSRGLGLTITKNIIENYGGHIDIDSDPQFGTKFSIILPVSN